MGRAGRLFTRQSKQPEKAGNLRHLQPHFTIILPANQTPQNMDNIRLS